MRWTHVAYCGEEEFHEVVTEQTVRLGRAPGWPQSADEPNRRVEIDGVPDVTSEFNLPYNHHRPHETYTDGTDPVAALDAARAVNFIPRLVEAAPGYRGVLDVSAPRAVTLALGTER